MSVAADGIWSGRAWLHGSIGWRTPHLGWRGAYVGNAIVGRHDRALTHFATYADNQVTDIPPHSSIPARTAPSTSRGLKTLGNTHVQQRLHMPPAGKERRNVALRHEPRLHRCPHAPLPPYRRHRSHAPLLPGDQTPSRLGKLNFDPDGDHLYDAYCCISGQ